MITVEKGIIHKFNKSDRVTRKEFIMLKEDAFEKGYHDFAIDFSECSLTFFNSTDSKQCKLENSFQHMERE